jgi:calcium-dependent protein kinase
VLLKKYDEKCDVWSTGVIMYMMLTHRPPFRGDNEVEVMQRILGSEPPLKEDLKNSKYSEPCLKLLQRMLIKNP